MTPIVTEIHELRQFIRQLLHSGTCPPLRALDHLFSGRAAGYIRTMSEMGMVEISAAGKIIHITT